MSKGKARGVTDGIYKRFESWGLEVQGTLYLEKPRHDIRLGIYPTHTIHWALTHLCLRVDRLDQHVIHRVHPKHIGRLQLACLDELSQTLG